MIKQKWLQEGEMFFPITGTIVVKESIGPGIWKVTQHPNPMDARLGLIKLSDTFEFPYKIYRTGGEAITKRIIDAWNSELYRTTDKNLGVIFNGYKGTGKTVAAKLLCNQMPELPVLIVDSPFQGAILDFIQNIQFECIVLIDEAEKTFDEDDQTLLKLIDGVYNAARKLYILTTNRLSVNENLIGRPGRVRYVKEFNNLPIETVKDFIEDNLNDKSLTKQVIDHVNSLETSTIDTLRSIVEEMNIFGNVSESMNLNRSTCRYTTLKFILPDGADLYDTEFRNKLYKALVDSGLLEMYRKQVSGGSEDEEALPFDDPKPVKGTPTKSTEQTPEEKFRKLSGLKTFPRTWIITSEYRTLYKGDITDYGAVVDGPDSRGFIVLDGDGEYGDGTEVLYLLLADKKKSIYRNLAI